MPKFEETETTPEAADAPAAAKNSNLWLPPGADSAEEEPQAFGEDLEEHFVVPPRLNGISTAIITAVNDFHFAMMNDSDRNEFYRQALRKVVGPIPLPALPAFAPPRSGSALRQLSCKACVRAHGAEERARCFDSARHSWQLLMTLASFAAHDA